MIELILAGIALVVCVALLLRMALPERQRQRVDAEWNLLVHRGLQHYLENLHALAELNAT